MLRYLSDHLNRSYIRRSAVRSLDIFTCSGSTPELKKKEPFLVENVFITIDVHNRFLGMVHILTGIWVGVMLYILHWESTWQNFNKSANLI
jgi:hypothetical protein